MHCVLTSLSLYIYVLLSSSLRGFKLRVLLIQLQQQQQQRKKRLGSKQETSRIFSGGRRTVIFIMRAEHLLVGRCCTELGSQSDDTRVPRYEKIRDMHFYLALSTAAEYSACQNELSRSIGIPNVCAPACHASSNPSVATYVLPTTIH
jgi:hypothetical protein